MARQVPSLREFEERFPDEEACWQHVRRARWGEGFTCPRCGEAQRWGFVRTRSLFQCNRCHYQCSVTAGTILEDTKLALRTWFLAAFLVLTTKKGISTAELARKLGVHQETAWFLHQKLARVVRRSKGRELFGLVEADETFLFGLRKPGGRGRGTGRAIVLGLVENRGEKAGRLRLVHVDAATRDQLHPPVEAAVRPGSVVRTDGLQSYRGLDRFDHDRIPLVVTGEHAHQRLPWVHTVFSNLKRVLEGVHTHVSQERLQPYLDVFEHRFNHRSNLGLSLIHI